MLKLYQNMSPFNLDDSETQVFSQVEVFNFWGGEVFVSGSNTNGAFQMIVSNFSSPFLEPTFPGLLLVQKEYADLRPAAFLAASQAFIPLNNMVTLLNNQLSQFASYGLIDSNFTISDIDYHEYLPHGSTSSITQSPTFYTKLKNLQGHRKTYYVGALASYAGTYITWEHAFNLIQANFPPRPE